MNLPLNAKEITHSAKSLRTISDETANCKVAASDATIQIKALKIFVQS